MSVKRKHPAWNVVQQLMSTHKWTFIIYWLIYFIAFTGIALLIHSNLPYNGMRNAEGVLEEATVSPKIFLLVIGIILTPMSLSSYVSNGVTRRHFIVGVSVFMTVLSIIFAILMTAGYSVEQFIYDKNNWQLEMRNPHLFTTASQVGWIMLEHICLFFVYIGSGWLIGSGFYRFDWRIGLLITLGAVLLVIAMEVLISSHWVGSLMQSVWQIERAPIGLLLPIAILLMDLVVMINYLMLRRVAIKKKG